MAAACAPEPTALTATPAAVLLVNDLNDPAWPSDPITLDSAAVTPTGRVRLFTRYGGGCTQHVAALLVDRAFMESHPPRLRARVAHDAKGDSCKAMVSATYEFDLAPIREHYRVSYQSDAGTVIVNAGGVSITYEFP